MTPFAINTGPIPRLENELENAKNSKDWFNVVVLCAVQLERHGYLRIQDYMMSLKVDPSLINEILADIHLSRVAKYLRSFDAINEKEFKTILKINDIRNQFIHRTKGYNFLIGTSANIKYEPLVVEAIGVLKEKLVVPTVHAFR